MHVITQIQEALDSAGFCTVEGVIESKRLEALVRGIGVETLHDRAGTRQLHQRNPVVAEFLRSDVVRECLHSFIPGAFAVRTILFDKTAESNWAVSWHQDLAICVREKHEVAGFGRWSVKDGAVHVHPPIAVLERMVTVRFHLDDCGEDNGPLQVIPGSHRGGRLSPEEIVRWREQSASVTCIVQRGGAVIMKPLLLHSSAVARNPKHRRVLHVEFAADSLPHPLEWIR